METLFDRITYWKTLGVWEQIKETFVAATTLERYFEIVLFVHEHRPVYDRSYREKILAHPDFIKRFGYLDLEYLKYAQKIMHKTYKIGVKTLRI